MNKMILKDLLSDKTVFSIIESSINELNVIIRIEDNSGSLLFGEQDDSLLLETCDIRVANDTIGRVKGDKNVYEIASLIGRVAQNQVVKEGLLKNIGDKNKIINVLYRLSEITSTSPINESKYLVLEEIMNYFESNIVFIALIDKNTNELSIEFQLFKKFGKVLSKNLSKNFININNPIIKNVINTNQGIIVTEAEKHPELSKMSLLIASFICVPIVYKNNSMGIIVVANDSVLDYKLSDLKVFSIIAMQMGIYLENLRLYSNVKETFFDTVKVIAKISEIRKSSLGKTNKRLLKFSVDIAKKMMLSEVEQGQVRLAAMICDIGEVSIKDEILSKEGSFSREEFKKLKVHPVIAAEIIQDISTLNHLVPIIRGHHERFDGTGYPDKLKGEHIPLISRIIAIASEFDAIISKEDFKINTDLDNAIEQLKSGKETKFDPEIVDEFLRVLRDKSKEEISDYIYKD